MRRAGQGGTTNSVPGRRSFVVPARNFNRPADKTRRRPARPVPADASWRRQPPVPVARLAAVTTVDVRGSGSVASAVEISRGTGSAADQRLISRSSATATNSSER